MRTYYYLIIALAAVFVAYPLVAQESDEEQPTAEVESVEEEVDELDDSDLDDQTYEEDDDDFVPSEEVPVDTPIPFPSNI